MRSLTPTETRAIAAHRWLLRVRSAHRSRVPRRHLRGVRALELRGLVMLRWGVYSLPGVL